MTTTVLGWLIAGIFITAFVALWLSVSYKELNAKRESLNNIREQVQLFRKLYMQERGGTNDTVAHKVLENKLMVYREVERDYNRQLKAPLYYIPGHIMGFRENIKEENG